MKMNTHYSISPILVITTTILNITFLFSKTSLRKDVLTLIEGPSLGYYILFFTGMVLTIYSTIIIITAFFRNARNNPGYMPYLLIYFTAWSFGYIACCF